MFDKIKFAHIIKTIKETYNSQEEFSKKSDIGRTYLSQYMNMKLDEPPKPKTLQKLAIASNGITSYSDLMEICGYTDSKLFKLKSLKEYYDQMEKNWWDLLSSVELNAEDKEIYTDLYKIIDIFSFDKLSEDEMHKKVLSYFENMDYITEGSKEKIAKKLLFFVQYGLQSKKLLDEINDLQYSISHPDSNKNSEKYKSLTIPSQFFMCPVYGRISAGQPNWAEECMEGRMPIDPNMMNIVNPEECYFLRVNGESMNKKVKNGAFALIQKTDYVENGEIAVVLVNGYDATLKKFSKQGDLIILEPMSTDPSFTAQVYDKNTEVKVIGKYLGKVEME